jgi:hypothetical protein
MTADVVNLRRARKAKVRGEAAATAAENRHRFGAAKSVREREAAEQALADRRFEAHRRDAAPNVARNPVQGPDDVDGR